MARHWPSDETNRVDCSEKEAKVYAKKSGQKGLMMRVSLISSRFWVFKTKCVCQFSLKSHYGNIMPSYVFISDIKFMVFNKIWEIEKNNNHFKKSKLILKI